MVVKFFIGVSLWLFTITPIAPAHKFYVSVTNVEYSESESAIQIISRIFIDDMEEVLQARYDFKAGLATEGESPMSDSYLKKYFNSKFKVFLNAKNMNVTFLGRRYDNDLVVCYLEVTEVSASELKSVEIENTLLTDIFEEQRNLVHFKIMGVKKSVVLTTDNTKGLLNL
jgi:hypothetical protein